jgi:hypothetical protein
MEKIEKYNWKVEKTNQALSQTLTLRLKHDKTRTQWTSKIMSKNMLVSHPKNLFLILFKNLFENFYNLKIPTLTIFSSLTNYSTQSLSPYYYLDYIPRL